jgi:hypothetical protein
MKVSVGAFSFLKLPFSMESLRIFRLKLRSPLKEKLVLHVIDRS